MIQLVVRPALNPPVKKTRSRCRKAVMTRRFADQWWTPRISEPKATCCCEQCGGRLEIDDLVAECPACGSRRITFEGGQELSLESIELED